MFLNGNLMLNSSRSSTVLLCLLGALALGSSACNSTQTSEPNRDTSAAPISKSVAAEVKKVATPVQPAKSQSQAYQLALDKAQSAKSMSQSVQAAEDWTLVVSRWKQAIALLKQVPKSDPNKKLATQKLTEYQQNLAIAQRRSSQTGKDRGTTLESGISIDTPVSENLAASSSSGNYRARIKYRQSRIPVIDVVFNGNRQFEMMVDTGASGTMITPNMARELQAKIVGKTIAMTPAGPTEITIGMIKSIQVGGRIVRDVTVAIGPVNLLGHDFFSECDISIRQEVVEFQQCFG